VRAGFDCQVAAGFLESGRTLAHVANAAALIAGVGCWWSQGYGRMLLVCSLAAWLVQTWFAVRVAIDRSLFQTLSQHPADGADWLDELLVEWKLVKSTPNRSMADRVQGALGLWRSQSAALAFQLAVLCGGLVFRAGNL